MNLLIDICNNTDIQFIASIVTTYIIANTVNKYINKATRDNDIFLILLATVGLSFVILGVALFILAKLFCIITGIYAYAIYILDGAMTTAGICMMTIIFIVVGKFVSLLHRKVTHVR